MAQRIASKKHIASKSPRIVVIGGGTGIFSVLTGLTKYFEDITAIVTMADDGGSTGMLREDFGMLPPGDIRRALVALSKTDNKVLAKLFNYRFTEGAGLTGHSFGNLMLAGLEDITGSFGAAVKEAAKMLSVRGRVLPVTLQPTRLSAELEDGTIIKGEANIDIPKHDGNLRVKRVWLTPTASLNPEARDAIRKADLVIIGPGDLYTSIVPNLIVKGMKEALASTKGEVLYFINTMTKFGETNHFSASDFLRVVESYLGKGIIDYAAVNRTKPSPARLKPYISERASWVEIDKDEFTRTPMLVSADLLRPRGFIRYDPEKVAKFIRDLA